MKKNALSILNMVKEEYKLSMRKIRFKACLNPEIEVPKMFYIAKKKGWNFDKVKAQSFNVPILLRFFKNFSFFCPEKSII